MPKNDNIVNTTDNTYKVRPSYFNQALHFNDKYKNMGYNYYGKILKNTTSTELWSNPLQINMYSRIESMITFILEQVKMIKKTYSIAHDKNSTNVN